jgi:hypothetical protein
MVCPHDTVAMANFSLIRHFPDDLWNEVDDTGRTALGSWAKPESFWG